MDEPKSFASIQKQVIWGIQVIKCSKICVLLRNWIDDYIIYFNDIILPLGDIDSTFILGNFNGRQN